MDTIFPGKAQAEDAGSRSTAPSACVDRGCVAGWRVWALAGALCLLVAGVFAPAVGHAFITYDDPAYVTGNAHVQAGLTWNSVRWAFSSMEEMNWHPLTWLSHMLDRELFGTEPWGHHLTNVLLHALNAVLLFFLLRRATGSMWRSLFVAALFGLHPLRVESVAWVSERKDALSTIFGLLSLLAYVDWVRRGARGVWGYAGGFLALAAGLMAKPMLVTFPCVMLLLDYWPLRRWDESRAGRLGRLVLEKLPFFALSAASCVVTYLAQNAGGAVKSVENFPLGQRVANALVAYCEYLGKCFWPTRLAVLYPNFGEPPPVWQTVAACVLLLAVTVVVVRWCRRGQLPVGWFWFLGTLVPVIGLVQVGGATMADRYSYVPLIGIFVAIAWTAGEAVDGRSRWRWGACAVGVVWLAVCGVLTTRQLARWENSETLFRHTLAVTERNWMAHYNLALAYRKSPETAALAEQELRETIRIIAEFAEEQNRRGLALLDAGRFAEAEARFQKAVRIKSDYAEAHYNLGRVRAREVGRLAEAVASYREALRRRPDYWEAQVALGRALAQQPGRDMEAILELRRAVEMRPDLAEVRCALGDALARSAGFRFSAQAEYANALRLDPNYAPAHLALGLILAETPGREAEAIAHLEAGLRGQPESTEARAALARLKGR